MNIIIEGTECVGKTTFAEKLVEATGYELAKGSSFELSMQGADEMFEHMMGLLDKGGQVIDRFLYSNLVYGEKFGYPMMSPEQYDQLVEKLDETSILVYMYSAEGVIEYRMNDRGDDMLDSEEAKEMLDLFKESLYGDYRPNYFISLDTTHTDLSEEIELIKKLI